MKAKLLSLLALLLVAGFVNVFAKEMDDYFVEENKVFVVRSGKSSNARIKAANGATTRPDDANGLIVGTPDWITTHTTASVTPEKEGPLPGRKGRDAKVVRVRVVVFLN